MFVGLTLHYSPDLDLKNYWIVDNFPKGKVFNFLPFSSLLLRMNSNLIFEIELHVET